MTGRNTEDSTPKPAAARGNPRGAGLSLVDIVLLTTYSTLLFLGYPQLLWRAPAGASHVGRFLVSYSAVVPFVAAYLYVRTRRISIGDLIGNVLIIWSIKMLVTVGLYHVFVQGSALELEPAQTLTQDHVTARPPYEGMAGFVGSSLRGRVTFTSSKKTPIPALVVLEGALHGAPAPGHETVVTLHIRDGAVEPGLAVAALGSELVVHNETAATVVLTATHAHRSLFNVPVVPGQADATVTLKRPGLLKLAPRAGATGLAAWLYVAEHPYFAWSGADGVFQMSDVPDGELELVTYTIDASSGRIVETRGSVTLPTSAEITLPIP